MNRRRSRRASWWALLAVLFAQLATAAYACPLIAAAVAPAVQAEVEAPGESRVAMHAHADDPSALCVEHCNAGKQRVDPPAPSAATTPAPVLLVRLVPTIVDDDAPDREGIAPPFLVRTTAPPVFASSSRLRI